VLVFRIYHNRRKTNEYKLLWRWQVWQYDRLQDQLFPRQIRQHDRGQAKLFGRQVIWPQSQGFPKRRTCPGQGEEVGLSFYVYAIMDGNAVFYVGKGSGNRLKCQERNFGLPGKILEKCSWEDKAFRRERYWIDKLKPIQNISLGGGGGRSKKPRRRLRKTKEDLLIEEIGLRAHVARFLLSKIDHRNCHKFDIPPSTVTKWREIACFNNGSTIHDIR
jgi:hypothetical protein